MAEFEGHNVRYQDIYLMLIILRGWAVRHNAHRT